QVSFQVNTTHADLFSAGPAVSADGTLTFTPAPNANGTATVSVAIHDDGGVANGGVDTSAAQTFTITVSPVNDPPVANPDTAFAFEDQGVGIDVLANDTSGPDSGETLRVLSATQPLHGFAVLCVPPPSGMAG